MCRYSCLPRHRDSIHVQCFLPPDDARMKDVAEQPRPILDRPSTREGPNGLRSQRGDVRHTSHALHKLRIGLLVLLLFLIDRDVRRAGAMGKEIRISRDATDLGFELRRYRVFLKMETNWGTTSRRRDRSASWSEKYTTCQVFRMWVSMRSKGSWERFKRKKVFEKRAIEFEITYGDRKFR